MFRAEDIVKRMIDEKYDGISAFAEKVNMPKQTIYSMLTRGLANANVENVIRIASELDIDVQSLAEGKVVSTATDGYPAGSIKAVSSSAFTDVPVLGAIAAGAPIDIEQWSGKTCPIPDEVMWRHPKAFLLEVCGDSMNRHVQEGSYALIDPDIRDAEQVDGKIVAVNVNGYDATLKRVRKAYNAVLLIPESYNPEHEVTVIDFDDPNVESIRIIGQMIWHMVPFDYKY